MYGERTLSFIFGILVGLFVAMILVLPNGHDCPVPVPSRVYSQNYQEGKTDVSYLKPFVGRDGRTHRDCTLTTTPTTSWTYCPDSYQESTDAAVGNDDGKSYFFDHKFYPYKGAEPQKAY